MDKKWGLKVDAVPSFLSLSCHTQVGSGELRGVEERRIERRHGGWAWIFAFRRRSCLLFWGTNKSQGCREHAAWFWAFLFPVKLVVGCIIRNQIATDFGGPRMETAEAEWKTVSAPEVRARSFVIVATAAAAVTATRRRSTWVTGARQQQPLACP